jgi:hypothetical protein
MFACWNIVCCQVEIFVANHSSRGVLPTVARCVRSINLINEEAIARAGLQSQRKKSQLQKLK